MFYVYKTSALFTFRIFASITTSPSVLFCNFVRTNLFKLKKIYRLTYIIDLFSINLTYFNFNIFYIFLIYIFSKCVF